MEWLILVAVMACVIGLIAGVGWIALFAMGFPPRSALFFAPPVGLGVLGVLTIVNGVVGWHWSWWQILGTIGVLLALAAWRGMRYQRPAAESVRLKTGSRTLLFGIVGVLAFSVVNGLMFLVASGGPAAVQSYGDAQFHYNGIQLILDGSTTSPFGGLAGLYDPAADGAQNYYPTLWHSLAALFASTGHKALASNAVMLAVTTVFWPWSLATIAVTVAPRKKHVVALIAPLLGLLVNIFPAGIVYMIAIHPLGLALSFFPGAVALVLLCVDSPKSGWLYVAAIVGAAGLFCAHPSVGLLLVIVAGVAALSGEAVLLKSLWRRGEKTLVWLFAGVTVLLIVAAFSVLVGSQYASELARFASNSVPYLEVIGRLFTGSLATSGGTISVFVSLVWVTIFASAIYGAWWTRRSLSTWVLTISGLAYALLYALAGGPENRLRALAGPWWKDDMRLVVPVLVVVIALATVGISHLWDWLRGAAKRHKWVWLVAAVVSAVVLLPSMYLDLKTIGHDIKLGYSLSEDAPSVLTDAKVAVLEAVDDEFGEGELLVGPYSSGVGFVGVYSDASSFYPKPRYDTADQAVLAQSFDTILTNPEVCEILERHNITGFMVDSPQEDHKDMAFEGFYNTNPTGGFELVTSVEGISLYRITACE